MTSTLKIVFGPMFSGKTTRLIYDYQNLLNKGENPTIINYMGDTESSENLVRNHNNVSLGCISCFSLANGWFDTQNQNYDKLHNSTHILINEAQFFEDLYDVVLSMIDSQKHVYIYGLDSDSNQHKFGQIWDLIPYANKVKKLSALCVCGAPNAIFTHRNSTVSDLRSQQQVLIGALHYNPLCRNCLPMRRHPNNI